MIHSLSGGVIAENGYETFVKVEVNGAPYWHLSPTDKIEEGALVSVPFGRGGVPAQGVVRKVEKHVSVQCAPVPMNRVKTLLAIL